MYSTVNEHFDDFNFFCYSVIRFMFLLTKFRSLSFFRESFCKITEAQKNEAPYCSEVYATYNSRGKATERLHLFAVFHGSLTVLNDKVIKC